MFWSELVETGNKDIDEGNMALYEKINMLMSAENGEMVNERLDCLEEIVLKYFEAQQKLHEKYKCPNAVSYRLRHRNYITSLHRLKKKCREEGETLANAIEFNNRVASFMKEYILDYNRDFAPYFVNYNKELAQSY
jgi:hemerythrin